MMAEQGRNMSLNEPVVDLQLLFVFCVKMVRFNNICNLLNPTGYWMHQQVEYSKTLHSAHNMLMCYVRIS